MAMAELTREQIEQERSFRVALIDEYTDALTRRSIENLIELCDLALRALDQEADARLGAAVYEALSYSGSATYEAGTLINQTRGVVSGSRWEALHMIRDALLEREEADHAE